MDKPSGHTRVNRKIYEQLRNYIVRDIWKPGQRVPSAEDLSRELDSPVSTVRRCLKRLQTIGFLESGPDRGLYVRTLSDQKFAGALFPFLAFEQTAILQVLEYRWIVEKGSASLAAKKATPEDILELENAFKNMEAAQDSPEAFALRDLEFHRVLAQATHNPLIMKANSKIKGILEVSVLQLVASLGVNDALFYHEQILKAVREHDRPAAERWMEEHIGRTVRRYIESEEA